MYEKKCEELLAWPRFPLRTVLSALGVGTIGCNFIARLAWVDALFSGTVFLFALGIVLAPLFHRILHQFHLDDG